MTKHIEEAPKTMKLNGVDYVRADIHEAAFNEQDLPYVVIRSADSGVHVGYMQYRNGNEVHLVDSKRIFYWKGAATLSQLAQEGVSEPNECKIPVTLPHIIVLGVCEVIPATPKCKDSLDKVPLWEC